MCFTIVYVFNIQLSEPQSISVQVKSEEWGGLRVDIGEEERIVDKSVLKAIICQVEVGDVNRELLTSLLCNRIAHIR